MGSNQGKGLSKKIIFDSEINLNRICWLRESFCPVCKEPMEIIFDDLPTEQEIIEAEKIPCDECLTGKQEAEGEDSVVEVIEDDHSDHNS